MKKNIVMIEARRTGYSVDQIKNTLTVGELIDFLSMFDEDAKVCLSFDNGYTYGGITEEDITEDIAEDEEE